MSARLLILGYGSIGARQARLAAEMGHQVACVTRNRDCAHDRFEDQQSALATFAPTHALIATETARHCADLVALREAGFGGPILVEKPLFGDVPSAVPSDHRIFVAYNLRFHPGIDRLRALIGAQPCFSAEMHAGQYLPQWRPAADYRTSYSAHRMRGGGVLRDLSHEIDLALWLFGAWKRVGAVGGTFGDLEIQSDDTIALVAQMQRCSALSLTLNYHNRAAQRRYAINAPGTTAVLDLVAGQLVVNGVAETFEVDRDTTYRAQLKGFLNGGDERLATMAEGLAVDTFTSRIEQSISSRTFVDEMA